QLERMRRLTVAFEAGLNLTRRHGTIARVMIGPGIADPPHNRARDLDRCIPKFALDPVRSIVPSATLDRIDLSVGYQHQHIARLETNVLHPRVTRHVVSDLTELVYEVGAKQSCSMARP